MVKWAKLQKWASGTPVMKKLWWNERLGHRWNEWGCSDGDPGFLDDSSSDWVTGGDKGPGGLPQDLDTVLYASAAGADPCKNINTRYSCSFTAPNNMVITRLKFKGREELSACTSWGADVEIFVRGYSKRWKRLSTEQRSTIWDWLGHGEWMDADISIRPIVVPKGASVIIRVHLWMEATAFGSGWIRIGNWHLGYRASWNIGEITYNFNNESKAFYLPFKSGLPDTSIRMAIRGTDEEGDDVTGVAVEGFRGVGAGVSLGTIVLQSMTPFGSFLCLASPGTETVEFVNLDGDGDGTGDSPIANYLGLGRHYVDMEDQINRESFTTDQSIVDTFKVEKRTPTINWNALPSRMVVGEEADFQGYLRDPWQSSLLDYLLAVECTIRRKNPRIETNFVSLTSQNADSNGAFNIPWTEINGGLDVEWRMRSGSTTQYNTNETASQTRTLWQIIETICSFRFSKDPPFYLGESPRFIGKVTNSMGTAIQGLQLRVVEGTTPHSGLSNSAGEYSYTRQLVETDADATSSFRTELLGQTVGYQEYQPSQSTLAFMTPEWFPAVATAFSRLEFERPEILKGEPATFLFRLAEQASQVGVTGKPFIMLQRQSQTQWVDLHPHQLDAVGAGAWSWPNPGDLLVTGESLTVNCRATFNGSVDKSVVPWKSFTSTASSSVSLLIYALPPGLGNLVLGVRLDNKDFAELGGAKSVQFHLDTPDYYGTRDFYAPQGVLVNPGTYTVTCNLVVGDNQFSKAETRMVDADQTVLLTFGFVSQARVEGTGRIVITLVSSAQLLRLGETVMLSGSVAFPSRARTIPLRFVKLRINDNDRLVTGVRTGVDGTFAAEYLPTTIGTHSIQAAVAGPLGQFVVARSGTLDLTVI